MMDDNKILERLRYSLRKNDVLNLAEIFSKQSNGIEQLVELTSNSDSVLAFHSAWVLEHIVVDNSELLRKWFIPIIDKMPLTKNLSVQRHYAKIVKCSLGNGAVKDIVGSKKYNGKIEKLIEVSFEWLLNNKTPIAVKAYCMDILMYFAPNNQWIKEELPHVIRLNMIDASPGISSKSKKVLEQLSSYEAS
jgi:hypothetical protein